MRAKTLAFALGQAPTPTLADTRPHEPAIDQPAIDRVDLAALDRVLRSERAPPNSMMLSELDGFLTGLAVGPELVSPSEWLPLAWGQAAPGVVSSEAVTAVAGALFARYNEILREIADDALAPVFWTDRDGKMVTADWGEGFLRAIKLRMDAWKPLFRTRSSKFLAPILWTCRDENGRSLLGLGPAADDGLAEAAMELIPTCVMSVAAYWRRSGSTRRSMVSGPGARGALHRAAEKTGRNDPCPCGSGNKFKRCCGQAG